MLHSWQHVSAVNSHHQAKIEQRLGTLKVSTLWDPIPFTIISVLKSMLADIETEKKLKLAR